MVFGAYFLWRRPCWNARNILLEGAQKLEALNKPNGYVPNEYANYYPFLIICYGDGTCSFSLFGRFRVVHLRSFTHSLYTYLWQQ